MPPKNLQKCMYGKLSTIYDILEYSKFLNAYRKAEGSDTKVISLATIHKEWELNIYTV